MNRKPLIAGNWKMNTLPSEGHDLYTQILDTVHDSQVDVIIAPPFLHLQTFAERQTSSVSLAAQNCATHTSGAYTGEISVAMLRDINVHHVIIGHSERRDIFGESDTTIQTKVNHAIENGMHVILCCGEALEVRDAGNHESYVGAQLSHALEAIGAEDMARITIAYEPIWAIGTGKTATPEQAQSMHAYIRKVIAQQYDDSTAERLRILYGGSVKPNNAKLLFSQDDVDGGLVGGASLDAKSFIAIIDAAKNVS